MLTSELHLIAEFEASADISAAKASHGQSSRWGNGLYTNKGAAEHPLLHMFHSQAPPQVGDYKRALGPLFALLFFFLESRSPMEGARQAERNGTMPIEHGTSSIRP